MGLNPRIMAPTPVPESVLKKQKTQKALSAAAATAAADARKARKEKRVAAYNNASKYAKEYRALAAQKVRMHRQAKATGNHFAEAKLLFVVRIRGLADLHPKTKKILQIMRLR